MARECSDGSRPARDGDARRDPAAAASLTVPLPQVPDRAQSQISRRTFLRAAAAGAGALGITSLLGLTACSETHAQKGAATRVAATRSRFVPTPSPTAAPTASQTPIVHQQLHTRPDLNGAPALQITSATARVQEGYYCLTPQGGPTHGPSIFDSRGRLVWFHPVSEQNAANLQVVRYNGGDALAWFEGDVINPGYGNGVYVFYNDQYTEVARIEAGGGYPLDLHELTVTPWGTVLVDEYVPTTLDLTPYGGVTGGLLLDCLIQEIDVASGDVRFVWRALDHVSVEESLVKPPTDGVSPYDYFHLNAIEVDRDGQLIISARNTSALYKIDRATGDIVWRMGGANDDSLPPPSIAISPASETFWFQHDVRRNPDGTLSIFDDGGSPYHHDGRGLVFDLDEAALKATVRMTLGSAMGEHVSYQGSMRQQANGNWLVGWGDVGRMTEFTPDGGVALDAAFSGNSYRVLPATWHGRPTDLPAIAAERSGGGTTVWASWNGATDIARWHLLGGTDASSLGDLGSVAWSDFETEVPSSSGAAMFAVEALDAGGQVLGRSAPVAVSS